jgi:uncharacterized protein YuzE
LVGDPEVVALIDGAGHPAHDLLDHPLTDTELIAADPSAADECAVIELDENGRRVGEPITRAAAWLLPPEKRPRQAVIARYLPPHPTLSARDRVYPGQVAR